MADTLRMNVCQRAKQLIYVKLDLQHRHRSLQLVEIPRCSINRFWYVFQNEVQINFVLLQRIDGMVSEEAQGQSFYIQKGDTYPLTIGVIESLQFYNVGMADNPHYL